jgi:hypothetical protein
MDIGIVRHALGLTTEPGWASRSPLADPRARLTPPNERLSGPLSVPLTGKLRSAGAVSAARRANWSVDCLGRQV